MTVLEGAIERGLQTIKAVGASELANITMLGGC